MNIIVPTTTYLGLSHDQRYNYYNDSDTDGAAFFTRAMMKMIEQDQMPQEEKIRKIMSSAHFSDLVAPHDGAELGRKIPNRKPRLFCVMKAEDYMALHRAEAPMVDIEYGRRRNRWLAEKRHAA
jgi:hypothetical protein